MSQEKANGMSLDFINFLNHFRSELSEPFGDFQFKFRRQFSKKSFDVFSSKQFFIKLLNSSYEKINWRKRKTWCWMKGVKRRRINAPIQLIGNGVREWSMWSVVMPIPLALSIPFFLFAYGFLWSFEKSFQLSLFIIRVECQLIRTPVDP